MVESISSIKEKFFAKVKDDKSLSDFFRIYASSKKVGDDSLGQRFVITDKNLNSLAYTTNENIFLDLNNDDFGVGVVTFRFTIPLLKKLGLDLALQMQEYLVNKK
ncbi:MAG: hypothetical protein AABW73_02070 [Nanoarchaeota archaeon]